MPSLADWTTANQYGFGRLRMTKIGLRNLADLTRIATMAMLRGWENEQPVWVHLNATTLILAPASVSVPACTLLIGVSSSPLRALRWLSSFPGRSTQMTYSYRTRCVEAWFYRLVSWVPGTLISGSCKRLYVNNWRFARWDIEVHSEKKTELIGGVYRELLRWPD